MTRLQYANFKVEHGWSKQSLSEVENLYYRQNEASSGAQAAARKIASTSPQGASRNGLLGAASTSTISTSAPPTTALSGSNAGSAVPSNSSGVGSRLFKDASLKRIDVEGGDVFGGYGLATPPASGGTVPGAHTSYFAAGKRGRSTSSTPVSPPNPTGAAATASSSTHSSGTKRSPNGAAASNSRSSQASKTSSVTPAASSSSSSGAGGAISYADFWSRVGSSSVAASAAPAGATNGSRPTSPSKKRNADNMESNEAAPAVEATLQKPLPVGTSAKSSSSSMSVSPSKRVRVDGGVSISPAKAALTERGPSFASGARK
ncbi:hypothetical protein BCV70DRAFT_50515 [Testicularia cyperi]|uniref:Uncharacterized protein n=1 Tax=Testicularia cyperi TaxID=1882483 RepID=A0A317XHF8_9BASI|nr:hypothetical protein BCV70DRAFT_50515 [Testicularia cyperi]